MSLRAWRTEKRRPSGHLFCITPLMQLWMMREMRRHEEEEEEEEEGGRGGGHGAFPS